MEKWQLSSGFGFHTEPMQDMDVHIRRGLEIHKELGFQAVNLSYAHVDAMGENYPAHMERAVQSAAEMGLRLEVAHLPYVAQKVGVPEGDAFAQRMRRCIDAFRIAGVSYAVVHPNSTSLPLEGYNEVAEYDNVMGHLAPFVEYADKVGLNIVIENMRMVHQAYPTHRYCANPVELCKVADALGIGICWDTGHAHIAGLKQSEAIAFVGQRLKMLHLNDNFAGDDVHLVPFVGTVDWADVVKGLSDINYEGDLNFEVGCQRLPLNMRHLQGEMMVAAGKELQRMLSAARNEE